VSPEQWPSEGLAEFCKPDSAVNGLQAGNGKIFQALRAVKAACVSDGKPRFDFPGAQYLYGVFFARFMAALHEHIFYRRTSLLADLEHCDSFANGGGGGGGQSCEIGDKDCAAAGKFAKDSIATVYKIKALITEHVFQPQRLRPILKILDAYNSRRKELYEVANELRLFACYDLVDFVQGAEQLIGKSLSTESTPEKVSLVLSSAIQQVLFFFGPRGLTGLDSMESELSGNDSSSGEDGSKKQKNFVVVDSPKFREAYGDVRKVFWEHMGNYEGPKGKPYVKPDLMDKEQDCPGVYPVVPAVVSQLEMLLSALVSEIPGAPKGPLVRLHEKLKKLKWSLSESAGTLDSIVKITVDQARGKVAEYFPVSELRGLQATARPFDNRTRGLQVGGVQHDIARSAPNVQYSWGDYTVSLIYLVKLVRFLAQLGALWIAVKIFKDAYVRKVYAAHEDPPSLKEMLKLFLGIDLTIQLILMTILVVILAPGTRAGVLVDDAFMSQLLIDELLTTVMIAILGGVVAAVIWRKTYFHYKVDGLDAIKNYGDLMVGVCAVMVVVPFFMLA